MLLKPTLLLFFGTLMLLKPTLMLFFRTPMLLECIPVLLNCTLVLLECIPCAVQPHPPLSRDAFTLFRDTLRLSTLVGVGTAK